MASPIISVHIIWGELAASLYKRGVINDSVRLAHAAYDFPSPQEAKAFLLGISEARKPHEWAQATRLIEIRKLGEPMRSKLLNAIINGDLDTVEAMLDAGVSIETKGPNGMTALQLAAQQGQPRIAEHLLSRGALAEEPVGSLNPHSAIHLASTSQKPGSGSVVNLLSQREIDLERADRDGKTALIRSIEVGALAASVILLTNGALAKTMDDESKTARDHFKVQYGAVVGDPAVDRLDVSLKTSEGLDLAQREKVAALAKKPSLHPTPYGNRY